MARRRRPAPYTPAEASQFLTVAGRDYPSIRSWNWTDAEGKIIASTRAKTIGLKVGDRGYFHGLCGGRSWVISDLLNDRLTGEHIFVIASRIGGPKGDMLGAVIATADVADLGRRRRLVPHFWRGHCVFDHQGVLVYNSLEQRKLFQDWRGDDPLLAAAIQTGKTQVGVLTLQGDNGASERDIAARVPVPDVGWVAGGRRPVDRAMASVYTGLWVAGGLNALVAAASGTLAWRTSDRFIDQLHGLQAHANAIGQGEFGHVAEQTGVKELADLAAAFNQMGIAVRDARRSQDAANAALRQHAEQLEKEIAVRKQAEELLQRTADQLRRSTRNWNSLPMSHRTTSRSHCAL